MTAARLDYDHDETGNLAIGLSGDWLLKSDLPDLDKLLDTIDRTASGKRIVVDGSGIGSWDTGLVSPLVRLRQRASEQGLAIEGDNLPEGAARLLDLAFAVPAREGARRQEQRHGLFYAERPRRLRTGTPWRRWR